MQLTTNLERYKMEISIKKMEGNNSCNHELKGVRDQRKTLEKPTSCSKHKKSKYGAHKHLAILPEVLDFKRIKSMYSNDHGYNK